MITVELHHFVLSMPATVVARGIMFSSCPSVPFLWCLSKALRGFLQIWYRYSLGLNVNWLDSGGQRSKGQKVAATSRIDMLIITQMSNRLKWWSDNLVHAHFYADDIMFSVFHPSHSLDILVTPWGNFITNIHLDSRSKQLEFRGERSNTIAIQCHNSWAERVTNWHLIFVAHW